MSQRREKLSDYRHSDDHNIVLPVDAPRARAFTTCPTVWIPPSAITGTPNRRAYSATLYTDVPWGRPHAITAHSFWSATNYGSYLILSDTNEPVISLPFTVPSWVMQMEPQPIPTLRASTPASMRFFAWAAVTTRGRQTHEENQRGSGAFERDGKAWTGCYHFHQPPGVQDISAWCSLSCWFDTQSFLGRSPSKNKR